MQTTAIYVRIDSEIKIRAQKVAKDLGFSLSSLINAWLRKLIKTKTVNFSVADEEKPSAYLIKTIKQALKDRKEGKASPVFNTGKEAVKWLEEQGI